MPTMAPAPGPISPPAGDVGSSSSAAPTHGETATSANTTASSSIRSPSHERPAGTEHTSNSNAPKTCACCGRLLDAPAEVLQQPVVGPAAVAAATAPSPSSIAFAPNVPSSGASTTGSIAAMLASTSAVSEALQLGQDGQHLCAGCAHNEQGGRTLRSQSTQTANITRATDAEGSDSAQSSVHVDRMIDRDGDLLMDQDRRGHHAPQQISPNPQPSTTVRPTNNASSTQTVHPWRRPAPWANIQRGSSERSVTRHTVAETPLTISIGNMGAGGDAQSTNTDDDVDFPPLARSPSSNNQLVTASSPRLPLSPARSRPGTTGVAPSSPPPLGRQSSFSRSQSGAIATSAGAAHAPVVNFPARGRHRTSSGSSSGPPSQSTRVRRPSATRRLSRSSSSQGPTATSFADVGEVTMGSAIVQDTFGEEPIAEDPFGPSSMTRPRLSTLDPWVIGSIPNRAPRDQSKMSLTDVIRKPFIAPELGVEANKGLRATEMDDSEEDTWRERLRNRYLVWLDCRRPDPRLEISRLRCRSQGRGCLFPGATFRGTQKSGRMSYDVTVQIVNVDLAASHLCGYLNIRGLTDDWPELTTYFDAEVIGQRYGFVTGKWGATEADDMKHWSRFTPFRPIRNSLTRPGLHFNHMNKPFIFMRWKERFLVPDHRVRDINGASFAGFYYVCVELGEDDAAPRQSLTSPASRATSPGAPPLRSRSSQSGETAMDGVQTDAGMPMSPNLDTMPPLFGGDPISATSGRMSGFYFHEHSEPYQQLTLRHVAETSTSTFEMR